jgi:hypothetical protein
MAWRGTDFAGRRDWILRLDAGDIAELEAAARAVMARRLDFRDIASADFPLPGLGPKLTALRPELRTGRGFVLVKGLAAARYERSMSAWASISAFRSRRATAATISGK